MSGEPGTAPRDAVPVRREVAWGAVVTAVLAVAGVPLGFLAAALTPDLQHVVYVGGGGLLFVSAYPDENPAAVGGDAAALAVLAGAGLLVGLAALAGRRRAPLGTVLGVLVGGLVGGVVAMAVAHGVVHGDYAGTAAAAGQKLFTARPYVRGRVDFVALPAVALVVFLAGNARWLLGENRRERARETAPMSYPPPA